MIDRKASTPIDDLVAISNGKPNMRMTRIGLLATLVLAVNATSPLEADEPLVEVYKSPSCGCCGAWAEHLEANGYRVAVREVYDLEPLKQLAGVPDGLRSCHTAMVDGYVLEGHVPADALDRFLAERPAAKGLAVPGMPAGSPGMPSNTPEEYQVFIFDADAAAPYATFVGPEEQ